MSNYDSQWWKKLFQSKATCSCMPLCGCDLCNILKPRLASNTYLVCQHLPNDFRNSTVARIRTTFNYPATGRNVPKKAPGISGAANSNSMLPVKCPLKNWGISMDFPALGSHGWEGRRGANQLTEDWIIGLNTRTTLKDYLANHDSVATRSPRGFRIFQDKKEPRTIKKDCKNDSIPLHCPILGDWEQHCAAGKENVFLFASENGCDEDHALKSLVDTMRRCLDQFQLEN